MTTERAKGRRTNAPHRRTKKKRAKRRANDYYPTPSWCVDRLLEVLRPEGTHIVEPCVGDRSIASAVRDWYAREWRLGYPHCPIGEARITTIDVRQDVDAHFYGDARSVLRNVVLETGRFDLAITNPPYGPDDVCQGIVRAMLDSADTVAVLVRVGWLAGRRVPLLRERPPSRVLVLPDRPSFTGRGTDASEYAWAVWEKGRPPVPFETAWSVLASTPRGVILAERARVRARLAAYDSGKAVA